MEEVISVIVPVYNAQALLPVCLDSLLSQSYRALQIVLVDDGSTDASLALCRDYANRDNRVCVVHQENQGVSAARNTGLQHAIGQYISFIDADDYVKTDYFERLYNDLKESRADMVCCDYIEVFNGAENPNCIEKVAHSRLLSDSREVFASIAACTESYWSCVWGKLIKAELAKAYSFSSSLKYGEDQVYMYDLFLCRPVIYLDAYKGYYYVRNETSATMGAPEYAVKRRLDEMRMCEYTRKMLPEYACDLEMAFAARYADSVLGVVLALAINGTQEEKRKYRKGILEEISGLPAQTVSGKGRIHFLLYRYCSGLYSWLLRRKFAPAGSRH